MLTIGELAAAAGTTTRAVRHYHALGVLPEPARRANGYREYDVRDLLRLVRVRRLAGLGLALDDVRRVVAGDGEREVRALLADVLADLERQERALRAQRRRLQALLRADGDPAVPEAVAAVLQGVEEVARVQGLEARVVDQEAELLELLGATLPEGDFARVAQAYREVLDDPEQLAAGLDLARRFDALAPLDADDPRVAELARAVQAAGSRFAAPDDGGSPGAAEAVWAAYCAGLPPAQRRCLELAQPVGGPS